MIAPEAPGGSPEARASGIRLIVRKKFEYSKPGEGREGAATCSDLEAHLLLSKEGDVLDTSGANFSQNVNDDAVPRAAVNFQKDFSLCTCTH
jgi:hypothetical protein